MVRLRFIIVVEDFVPMVTINRKFENGHLISETSEYHRSLASYEIQRGSNGFLEKIIVTKKDGTEVIIE